MVLRTGDSVGDFELLEQLDEDAVATRWKARRGADNRIVQFDAIRPDRVPPPARRRAFEHLVAALTKVGRLEHHGLIHVIATAIRNEDAVFGLASEHLPGGPIGEAESATSEKDLPKLGRLATQLIEVVAWLHSQGVVHGYLDSQNTWVVPAADGPQVKLTRLCWSHANLAPPSDSSSDYLAPERRGGSEATEASDQWTVAQLIADLIYGHVAEVDAVLDRARDANVSARFPNVRAMGTALQEVMPAASADHKSPSATMRLAPVTTEDPTEDLQFATGANTEEVLAVETPTDRIKPVKRRPSDLASINPSADSDLPAAPRARPQDPTDVFKPVKRRSSKKAALVAFILVVVGAAAAVGAVTFLSHEGSPGLGKATTKAEIPAPKKVEAPPPSEVAPEPPAVEEVPAEDPPKVEPNAAAEAAKVEQDALRASCKNGRARDCIKLASLVPRESASLHWRACRLGSRTSCWTAGRKWESRKPSRARRAYEKSCDSGRGQACARLAYLLRRGLGGAPNTRTADAFEKRACRLGHKASCTN